MMVSCWDIMPAMGLAAAASSAEPASPSWMVSTSTSTPICWNIDAMLAFVWLATSGLFALSTTTLSDGVSTLEAAS